MTLYTFTGRQEIAFLLLHLYIAKTYKLSLKSTGSRKCSRHFIGISVLVGQFIMQIHKSTALCHNRHSSFKRIPDRCSHADINLQFFCKKLRIATAKQQSITGLWDLFIMQRRKKDK